VPFKGPNKVLGPSQSLDFVPGPFRILEMAPFSDFQRVYLIISHHIYSTLFCRNIKNSLDLPIAFKHLSIEERKREIQYVGSKYNSAVRRLGQEKKQKWRKYKKIP
jgi:hypothetical protein